jgi:hypothetical protein
VPPLSVIKTQISVLVDGVGVEADGQAGVFDHETVFVPRFAILIVQKYTFPEGAFVKYIFAALPLAVSVK